MKFFKQQTMGNIVIMGRKTFESLPGRKPLPGRVNIVMSRDKKLAAELKEKGFEVCSSLEEMAALTNRRLKEVSCSGAESEVYVIGGEAVYELFLPYCSEAFVTKMHKLHEADKHFKNLDADKDWELAEESEVKSYNGLEFVFCRYVNKNAKSFL
jgi:dihydrofolate reductase